MTFETTDIKDVVIVYPKTFPDSRCYFRELTYTNLGKCVSVNLSTERDELLYVPNGFAHGF